MVGKPLALLTFLHAAGGAATREQLVDLLWADVPPESGRHTLRQTLWYIRKRLGGQLFATDGDIVRLVAPLSSDRADFLRALDAGDAEAAFQIYTGDFFPGFASPGAAAFEQWADLERQRLRTLFIGAAGRVVRARLEAGRARDALAAARRARDLAPTSQAAWRMVLESLVAAGDLVGAKAEAVQLLATLAADDFEPEPATQQLLRVVESGRPVPDAPPDARTLAAELVGRDEAFAALLQAYERAARSAPQHVHISAPAGLGKTRLLDGLAARVRSQRGTRPRLIAVRTTPAERALPYAFAGQLVTALVALRGAAAVSPDTASTLVALAPAASTWLSATPDRSTGDEALRRRALALTELVTAVADDTPIALLIDDVHWMDGPSRTLVAALAERLDKVRALLVTTGRGADAFADLTPRAQRLPLAPLSIDDVGALITSVAALPAEPWAELFPTRLQTATGGSPLLVIETLQLAIEREQLRIEGGTWQCGEPAALLSLLGAGHALQQRVAALPASARDVLLALAVAGEALNEDSLRRVTGVEVHEPLTLLETRGLVTRMGDLWRPAHDEIAAIAVDMASARDRAGMHAALADWLETQAAWPGAANVARALWHRWRSGNAAALDLAVRRYLDLRSTAVDPRPAIALVREAVGSDATPEQVQQLVDRLPRRYRRESTRWLPWLAASAALVMAAAFAVRPAAPPLPSPDLTFVTRVPDDSGRWQWVRGDISLDRFTSQEVLELTSIDAPLPDALINDVTGVRGIVSGEAILANSVRRDTATLAIDVVRLSATASAVPVVTAARDQSLIAVSPGGEQALFVDRRYWPSQAGELALLDLTSGATRRLTNTPDEERAAQFSPDGTQIAFVREGSDTSGARVCRMRLADGFERCALAPADYVPSSLRAWRGDGRLLMEVVSRESGLLALVLLSADDRRATVLHEGAGLYSVDPLGQVAIASVRLRGFDRPGIAAFTVDQPQVLHQLRWDGKLIRRIDSHVFDWKSTPPAPARVTIAVPDSLVVGERARMTATAFDRRGRETAVAARTWSSRDASIADVDSTGMLMARAIGSTQIVMTLASGVSDTAVVRIVRASERVVLRDRFAEPLASRWFLLGTPLPKRRQSAEQSALHIDGDERLESAAVSRLAVDGRRGVGLRVRFRLPITRDTWQQLQIGIEPVAGDSALGALQQSPNDPQPESWRRWRTERSCELRLPRGEGRDFRHMLAMLAAGEVVPTRAGAPPFGDRGVHTAEIQVFTDGRCAFRLDGVLLGVSEHAVRLDLPMRVYLAGQSVGTIVAVEEIEFWQGVRVSEFREGAKR